jgi:hypothetical protein
MEDLTKCLSRIGYRVRPNVELWQVSRFGGAMSVEHNRSPCRATVSANNWRLRLWLDRLSDCDRSAPYLIRRVES